VVVQAKKPSVACYRFLYDALGRDYDWTSRRKLSDAEPAALPNDPRLEVHVLMVDGVPAGFAELDRRTEGELELVQFGLMRAFIGQGLGKYFCSGPLTKPGATVPNGSGCTLARRTIRLLCRTISRQDSPFATRKRSRSRGERNLYAQILVMANTISINPAPVLISGRRS
jgi:hypothetical protein